VHHGLMSAACSLRARDSRSQTIEDRNALWPGPLLQRTLIFGVLGFLWVVFSTAVSGCYAKSLSPASFRCESASSAKKSGAGLFLFSGTEDENQIARKKPGIFRWSYKGPPYILESERRDNLFARLWRDIVVQAKAPFGYARHHPVRFGLGVAAVGTLVATDRRTLSYFAPKDELREYGLVKLAKQFSRYGEVVYAVPIIVGFGGYGWLADSPREKETFLMVTEALASSAAWTGLLKVATGRERPSQREAPESDWTGPFGIFSRESSRRGKQLLSFPSGHSSAMWAIATVLAHQYRRTYVVPILSYAAATGVAYSRMVVDAHWFSDIVVGSGLGYFCARQVIRDNQTSEPAGGRASTSAAGLHLDVSTGYCGIEICFGG